MTLSKKLICFLFHGYKQKYRFIKSVKPDYCETSRSYDYVVKYGNMCSCGCESANTKVLFTGYNEIFTWGKKSLYEASLSARAKLFAEFAK
jgi:hypothetical protein